MKIRFVAATILSSALLVTGCTNAAPENEEPVGTSELSLNAETNKDLAEARRATARYHDVANALEDGYVADPHCAVREPDRGAAMGVHYVNQALTRLPPDAARPPILVYEPTADGLRLVAVEYFKAVIINGRPHFGPTFPGPAAFPQRPTLFGQPFDGPMPGHNPAMPWHFDLHVWLWKHNPDGMFAIWNPNVTCPDTH